jgi:glucose/arabinose dehydrogenase/PKD repeat protein
VRGEVELLRALACAVAATAAFSACASAARAAILPAGFSESVVLEGLEYPTAVRFAGDGRVFVAEKSGRVLVFSSLDDPTPAVFADLSTPVYNFWDRGLLGLALDPAFPERPYVYVSYTHDAEIGGTAPRWGAVGVLSDPCPPEVGATRDGCVVSGRVSRLEADGDAMTGSEQILVEDWCQQFPSHSVGELQFGADGALYASGGEGANFFQPDGGQFGNPPNPCGDPPEEGGALRSQDLRTRTDPTGLGGTLIRIDPETGAAKPDNPLSLDPDANARRIVAYGLRNPFRFAIRPGTSDVWIGDVGGSAVEEIDRVATPAGAVADNFGWPCREGGGANAGFADFALCQTLAADAVAGPVTAYAHWEEVVPGDGCGTGTSSLSGLAFYRGGHYPGFDGALFFADYSRECIWAMHAGVDGLPDPSAIRPFAVGGSGPVDLEIGPGGDLFYVDFNGGSVRRIEYLGDNSAPIGHVDATPTSGLAPLEVTFDGTGSSDPDPGGTLEFAWDLDGDGLYDDSTEPRPTWTYEARGTYTAALRVTDPEGATDRARVVIRVSTSAPVPAIELPGEGARWTVDEEIAFAGSAWDAEDGELAPAQLDWTLLLHHCPSGCHVHVIEQFDGVASGSFAGPDHSYPSHLELRLTATDADGVARSTSRKLQPETVALTFATSPAGLLLTTSGSTDAAPFTRQAIVGSNISVSATSPQLIGETEFTFSRWSDGGARTHQIRAPAAPTTYSAAFEGPPTSSSLPPAPPPPSVQPPASSPPPTRPSAANCVVPRLAGRTVVQARRAIVAARCSVGRVTRAHSRRVRAGRVISQRPRPRLRLRRGTKVAVVVSRGRRR